MTNSPLISVIVPIYNVAAYLPRCVDSILAQTYKNLEIILVDDGSTDNCLEICQQYAQKDNRIKVIHQENQGVSAARNTGLDNMHGDFVAFVDPDDWLPENAYEILIDLHQKTGADIAWGGFCRQNQQNTAPGDSISQETRPLQLNMAEILRLPVLFCWDKLYTRRLFAHGLRFNTNLEIAEDMDFVFHALQLANFTAFINKPVYNYFLHKSSVSHIPNIRRCIHAVVVYEEIHLFAQKHKWQISSATAGQLRGAQCNLLTAILLYDKEDKFISVFQKTLSQLREHVREIFASTTMGWPGKLFMLFPLIFPRLSKKLFRTKIFFPILHRQYINRMTSYKA